MRREYASLSDGLVGAWCPSLGATGYLLPDRSGFQNHCTNTGTTWQATTGGVAIETNGTSAFSQTSGTAARLNSAIQATLSAWMWRASVQSVGCGFANSSTSSASAKRFSFVWWTDGNIYFSAENGSGNYASASLSGIGWNHVVAVFQGSGTANASRLLVYINGRQATLSFYSAPIPSTLSSDLGVFCIGKDASDRFCAGRYDDVRVYNRALTQQELTLLSSRRGIGLTPYRQRRTSASSKRLWANIGGTWKETTPYINVAGTWKEAAVYRHDGAGFKN